MKYGMRERISGIVIIVALALILLPILFGGSSDEDESSNDSSVIIEQPIEMSQPDVAAPQSPLPEDDGDADDASDQSGQASQNNQLFPDHERESASAQTPASSEPSSSRTDSRDSATTRAGNGATSSANTGSASTSKPATPARDSNVGNTQRQAPARSDDSSGDPIMAAANRNSHSASQTSGSGGWAVQAGSFGQPGNADRLIEQLKAQGFSAYKQPRGELNTVYVGPFGSTEESERARAELQEKANIKGLIVRREGGQ